MIFGAPRMPAWTTTSCEASLFHRPPLIEQPIEDLSLLPLAVPKMFCFLLIFIDCQTRSPNLGIRSFISFFFLLFIFEYRLNKSSLAPFWIRFRTGSFQGWSRLRAITISCFDVTAGKCISAFPKAKIWILGVSWDGLDLVILTRRWCQMRAYVYMAKVINIAEPTPFIWKKIYALFSQSI